MRSYLIICLLIGSFTKAFAQNVRLPSVMPTISVTLPITKKLDFNFTTFLVANVTNERVKDISYPAQGRLMLIQPSLVYRFSPNLNVAASWAYIIANPLSTSYNNISCPWQQVTYSHRLGGGRVWHRLRFEGLFVQKNRTNVWPFSSRFRYQIGFIMPIQGSTLETNEFYVNANHESFINTSGKNITTFSENWNYVGVGYTISERSKLEVGFMNMSRIRNLAFDNLVYNSLQVSYFVNLFSKSSSLKAVLPNKKRENIHFKSWPPN